MECHDGVCCPVRYHSRRRLKRVGQTVSAHTELDMLPDYRLPQNVFSCQGMRRLLPPKGLPPIYARPLASPVRVGSTPIRGRHGVCPSLTSPKTRQGPSPPQRDGAGRDTDEPCVYNHARCKHHHAVVARTFPSASFGPLGPCPKTYSVVKGMRGDRDVRPALPVFGLVISDRRRLLFPRGPLSGSVSEPRRHRV